MGSKKDNEKNIFTALKNKYPLNVLKLIMYLSLVTSHLWACIVQRRTNKIWLFRYSNLIYWDDHLRKWTWQLRLLDCQVANHFLFSANDLVGGLDFKISIPGDCDHFDANSQNVWILGYQSSVLRFEILDHRLKVLKYWAQFIKMDTQALWLWATSVTSWWHTFCCPNSEIISLVLGLSSPKPPMPALFCILGKYTENNSFQREVLMFFET